MIAESREHTLDLMILALGYLDINIKASGKPRLGALADGAVRV